MANLATLVANPYSIEDTSNGDPRFHAYRRIALCAYSFGWDAKTTEQSVLHLLDYPKVKKPYLRARSIDDLGVKHLERAASMLENRLDNEVYA